MNKKLPQITISIARGTDRGEVTSDLNSLSVGLGLFLAWFFLALLSTGCIHAFSEGAPEMFPVPGELVPLLNLAALLACAVFLLVAAFTNQRLLAFYVSRPAPVAATVLAVAGTALLCVLQRGRPPGVRGAGAGAVGNRVRAPFLHHHRAQHCSGHRAGLGYRHRAHTLGTGSGVLLHSGAAARRLVPSAVAVDARALLRAA